MNRILTHTALTATLATFAFAQTPQTSTQTTTFPRTEQPASADTTVSSQMYRGILMDASCQAIQSRSAAATSAGVSHSRVTPSAGAQATPGATTGASPPSSTDASTSAAVSTAASGPVLPTTPVDGARVSPQSAATTGVNPNHAGQPPANTTTPPAEHRSTASAAAAGSSPLTTYSGPAGSVARNHPNAVQGSPGTSAATTHIGNSSSATGERSRAADTASTDAQTVREKYNDCRVTPKTTSFALMSEGKLYIVEDAGGLLRQRASSTGAASDWHTVAITGTLTGDRLSASAVQ